MLRSTQITWELTNNRFSFESDVSVLQLLKNEADHGRSSRSPVTLFDIQENNNVNSLAV